MGNRSASPFPRRRPFVSAAPPTNFPRAAHKMKNERSRFAKRTHSFFKTTAFVSQRRRLAGVTKGRRGGNGCAPLPKRLRPAFSAGAPWFLGGKVVYAKKKW